MPPTLLQLQRWAIIVSAVSVVYNAAEGGISIGLGQESDSRSLIFFGIQSGIETLSSGIVVWRFYNVAKPGEESSGSLGARELRIEKTASLVIGVLLCILALATEGTAISSLVRHQEPEISNSSLIFSATTLVLMIFFWLPKRYLARELNSSVMQGEAVCSLSCIQTTAVLFAGSLIYRVWKGGWWVDSATTLLLGLLFGWEGFKMVRWARDPEFNGGCCKHGHKKSEESVTELASTIATPTDLTDVCECCVEKVDCMAIEDCKCVKATALKPVSCCTPTGKNGENKQCGRDPAKGRAVAPVPTVKPPTSRIVQEDSCCSTDHTSTSTSTVEKRASKQCSHSHSGEGQ